MGRQPAHTVRYGLEAAKAVQGDTPISDPALSPQNPSWLGVTWVSELPSTDARCL